MTPADRAAFLVAIASRIGTALDATTADCVVVPMTREEIETALDCINAEDDSLEAIAVRAVFLRALRQMAAEDN